MICISLMTNEDNDHFFHVFIGHLDILLEKYLFKSFDIFGCDSKSTRTLLLAMKVASM